MLTALPSELLTHVCLLAACPCRLTSTSCLLTLVRYFELRKRPMVSTARNSIPPLYPTLSTVRAPSVNAPK